MENTVKIKHRELALKHFNQFPVWTWVEDSPDDLVCPVLETNPLPDDLVALFIKADFWSSTKAHFDGYVVVNIGVFAIDLFVQDKVFSFNIRLKDLAEQSLSELRKTIGDKKAEIFPLYYETKFRFANEDLIVGIFDPFKD